MFFHGKRSGEDLIGEVDQLLLSLRTHLPLSWKRFEYGVGLRSSCRLRYRRVFRELSNDRLVCCIGVLSVFKFGPFAGRAVLTNQIPADCSAYGNKKSNQR